MVGMCGTMKKSIIQEKYLNLQDNFEISEMDK